MCTPEKYISVSEYAEKYSVSKVAIYKAVKQGRLISKEDFAELSSTSSSTRKKKRMLLFVEDRDVFAGDIFDQSDLENLAIKASGPRQVGYVLQTNLGGSTDIQDWTNDVLNLQVEKVSSLFVDTVFVCFPTVVRVLIVNSREVFEAVKECQEQHASILKTLGVAQEWEFEGRDITGDYFETDEGIFREGLQIYRVSTCNLGFEKAIDFIFNVAHGLESKANFRFRGRSLKNHAHVLQVDITRNIAGAVKSYMYPPMIDGFEAKVNKHWVGLNCHTYIDRSEHEDLSFDYGDCLEAKVYDKAKFQLETQSVSKNFGQGYQYFLSSPQANIDESLRNKICLGRGFGRVETRFKTFLLTQLLDRGKEEFSRIVRKINDQHITKLAPILTRRTSINESFERFWSSVKATVSVYDKETGEWYLFFGANRLTGKAQGLTGEGFRSLDEAIKYRSIRHIPHIQFDIVPILEKERTGEVIDALRIALESPDVMRYEKGNKKAKFYRIEKARMFAPCLGKANLVYASEERGSQSKLCSLSFAGKGLDNFPFEPQIENPRPRRVQMERVIRDLSFSAFKKIVFTRSNACAKSRARRAYSEIVNSNGVEEKLDTAFLFSQMKDRKEKILAGGRHRGILFEKEEKAYLLRGKDIFLIGKSFKSFDRKLLGQEVSVVVKKRKNRKGISITKAPKL